MDFKQLHARLAQIAAQRNEKHPFMEGNPKVLGGYGKPDPDWALLSIYAGEQEGILSPQQGEMLRKQFEPYARFDHRNGEVHVRAHTREGKPVAAYTRHAPDRAGGEDAMQPKESLLNFDPRLSTAETAPNNTGVGTGTTTSGDNGVDVAQNTNIGGSAGRSLLKLGLESYQVKTGMDKLEGADLEKVPQDAANILKDYDAVERKVIIDSIKDGADYMYMKQRNKYITLDRGTYRKLEGILKPHIPRR